MGYLTLGADGRVTKDDQSVFAQGLVIPRNYQDDTYYNEVFPGSIELGKKKKKGFFKKLKSVHRKLHKKLSPVALLMSKLKKKKKRGGGGDGDEMGPEQEGEASAATEMTETSGQSQQIVPESAPPSAPSVEQRAESYPNDSPPVREEEGHAPPPVPDSGPGQSDETATPPPWARDEAPEPEPSPFAPGEGHASVIEADEPPESSVEGMGIGGWLTTDASPTQHAWENRSRRSRLRAPRGRGGEVSVYTAPRSRATPPMWAKAFGARRDRMGRSGLGALGGPLSDGANVLLTSARGEVSQSWAALDQARVAWNQRRRVNYPVNEALKAALITANMFKTDADKTLIARGIEAGKKLNGWLNAQNSFMTDHGEALDRESPALVTEIGKWVDVFVPARNAVADGFMKSPLWEGIKAGASTFGSGLYNLAAGVARVVAKAGGGIERALEGGIPWWVWVGGGLLIVNSLRK
jgi:hypothetical protein